MSSGPAKWPHGREGITLIEVLIAGTLLLLITGALATVLSSSFAHSERVSGRLELNAQALTALSHIKRELSESSLPCVDVTLPQALIFPSPRTAAGGFDNATGQLTYHKIVCFRSATLDGETRLLRQEEGLSATTLPPEPATLAPPRDGAYFAASSLPTRVMARGITRFECLLEIPDDDLRRGRVHLLLGLQRTIRGRTYGIEVESAVAVLN